MNAEIKAVARNLYRQFCKDFPFFGTCGAVIGWFMVVQYRLKESGIAPKESWADALFHSWFTMTRGGATLAALIFLFDCLVVVGFISASLVARRNYPFDRWWVGAVMLALAGLTAAWFIFRGAK